MMILTIDQSHKGNITGSVYGEPIDTDNLLDINCVGKIDIINSIDEKIKDSNLDTTDKWFFIGRSKEYNKLSINKNAAYLRNSGDMMTFHGYNSKADWVKDNLHNVEYYGYITSIYVHKNKNEIVDKPEFQDTMAHPNGWIYYDKENTFEENAEKLNNFKKFIKTSNLAHYLSFIHPGIGNHKFMPMYMNSFNTDKDIYDFFGFNENEINLIEHTAKKLTKDSEFFKRYNGVYDN